MCAVRLIPLILTLAAQCANQIPAGLVWALVPTNHQPNSIHVSVCLHLRSSTCCPRFHVYNSLYAHEALRNPLGIIHVPCCPSLCTARTCSKHRACNCKDW